MPEISDEELARYREAEAERERLRGENASLKERATSIETAYSRDMERVASLVAQPRQAEAETDPEPENDDLWTQNPRKVVRETASKVYREESAEAVKALTKSTIENKLDIRIQRGELTQKRADEIKKILEPLMGDPRSSNDEVLQRTIDYVRGKYINEELEERVQAELKKRRPVDGEDDEERTEEDVEDREEERRAPAKRDVQPARQEERRPSSPVAIGSSGGRRSERPRTRLNEEERTVVEAFGLDPKDLDEYADPNYSGDFFGGKGRRKF